MRRLIAATLLLAPLLGACAGGSKSAPAATVTRTVSASSAAVTPTPTDTGGRFLADARTAIAGTHGSMATFTDAQLLSFGQGLCKDLDDHNAADVRGAGKGNFGAALIGQLLVVASGDLCPSHSGDVASMPPLPKVQTTTVSQVASMVALEQASLKSSPKDVEKNCSAVGMANNDSPAGMGPELCAGSVSVAEASAQTAVYRLSKIKHPPAEVSALLADTITSARRVGNVPLKAVQHRLLEVANARCVRDGVHDHDRSPQRP